MSKNISAKEIYDIANITFDRVRPGIIELADNTRKTIKKLFDEKEVPLFSEAHNEQDNICGQMDSHEKLLVYSRICDLVQGTFSLALLMSWIYEDGDKDAS